MAAVDRETSLLQSPDCVSFLDVGESMLRLPHTHDVEMLLSDRMVDEIGRALEEYPYANPFSACPSPRTESPWPLAPMSSTACSSSTMASTPEPSFMHMDYPEKKKPKQRTSEQKPITKKLTKKPSKKRILEEPLTESGQITPANIEATALPQKKRAKSSDANKLGFERSRKSSSTYRGVSLCTKDSRWQARIRIKKEVVYLGRFETEEAAARRYDDAAREHHGDKALINFITDEDRALGRRSVFEQIGGKSARV